MGIQDFRETIERDVRERFLRYVRVYTTSDRHSETTPSSKRQFDLAEILAGELRTLGVTDVEVTEFGYVIARLPATAGIDAPAMALLAHMDTAPDSSGENVSPRVWEDYDGGRMDLGHGIVLDPADYPDLTDFVGETIITADGSTLLGADDKAGVAEIMATVRFLVEHPEHPHPELEIVFTPDEEIGRGVDKLEIDGLRARFAYTVDGGKEGSIEAECFNAYKATIEIEGYVIHPGSARGKMANAVTIAGRMLAMLPQNESPEATDGRFGFYCPVEVRGDYGHAEIELIIRDFDIDEVHRRVAFLQGLAQTMQHAYPGAHVTVTAQKQYLNMADRIAEYPFLMDLLTEAIASTGATPLLQPIRGGTDGSRLTEMGLPTPNIFAGGLNFHGPYEWIPLRAMVRATETLVSLLSLWSERVPGDTVLPKITPGAR